MKIVIFLIVFFQLVAILLSKKIKQDQKGDKQMENEKDTEMKEQAKEAKKAEKENEKESKETEKEAKKAEKEKEKESKEQTKEAEKADKEKEKEEERKRKEAEKAEKEKEKEKNLGPGNNDQQKLTELDKTIEVNSKKIENLKNSLKETTDTNEAKKIKLQIKELQKQLSNDISVKKELNKNLALK